MRTPARYDSPNSTRKYRFYDFSAVSCPFLKFFIQLDPSFFSSFFMLSFSKLHKNFGFNYLMQKSMKFENPPSLLCSSFYLFTLQPKVSFSQFSGLFQKRCVTSHGRRKRNVVGRIFEFRVLPNCFLFVSVFFFFML